MTVGNPENFQVKIKMGREEVDKRVPCDFSNLTLKKLFAWIDSKNLSSVLKAELKKSASSFPHQALPNWQRGFDKHLSKAQAKLRKKKLSHIANNVEEEKEEEIIEKDSSLSSSNFMDSNEFDNFEDPGLDGGGIE